MKKQMTKANQLVKIFKDDLFNISIYEWEISALGYFRPELEEKILLNGFQIVDRSAISPYKHYEKEDIRIALTNSLS